jgi:hypothetical protein
VVDQQLKCGGDVSVLAIIQSDGAAGHGILPRCGPKSLSPSRIVHASAGLWKRFSAGIGAIALWHLAHFLISSARLCMPIVQQSSGFDPDLCGALADCSAGSRIIMAKSHLKLVSPTTENRTVTPRRPTNAELRSREYLTAREAVAALKQICRTLIEDGKIRVAPARARKQFAAR